MCPTRKSVRRKAVRRAFDLPRLKGGGETAESPGESGAVQPKSTRNTADLSLWPNGTSSRGSCTGGLFSISPVTKDEFTRVPYRHAKVGCPPKMFYKPRPNKLELTKSTQSVTSSAKYANRRMLDNNSVSGSLGIDSPTSTKTNQKTHLNKPKPIQTHTTPASKPRCRSQRLYG